MQSHEQINLIQIDSLVDKFLEKYKQGINTLHRMYFKNSNALSLMALNESLKEDLRTGCVTFTNNKLNWDELDQYLFYIVNASCKKISANQEKKIIEHICPGCSFLGINTIVSGSKNLKCNVCSFSLEKEKDQKMISFFNTFYNHDKCGYKCNDCKRFIPHPKDNEENIICPYLDCCFSGRTDSLNKMIHPKINSKINTSLDIKKNVYGSFKDNLISNEISALSILESKQDIYNIVNILKDTIEQQINAIPYNSSDFTLKHKLCCYEAFLNLINKEPVAMANYLLYNSRSGGFQHKIFQEYIKLLEKSMPFFFKKNNKFYKVESLLDENLNIFDGISNFESKINDKLSIKNNTKEFYIGGRKGYCSRPFYIGKILKIIDKKTNKSLIDNIDYYSFSKIKMKNIPIDTSVIVTHLRIVPHYQMGGMLYVNRIRKKIIERVKVILDKNEKKI